MNNRNPTSGKSPTVFAAPTYRPPQYRLVMLPIVVLRRLDCVLEPRKEAVFRLYAILTAQNMPENAMNRLLG